MHAAIRRKSAPGPHAPAPPAPPLAGAAHVDGRAVVQLAVKHAVVPLVGVHVACGTRTGQAARGRRQQAPPPPASTAAGPLPPPWPCVAPIREAPLGRRPPENTKSTPCSYSSASMDPRIASPSPCAAAWVAAGRAGGRLCGSGLAPESVRGAALAAPTSARPPRPARAPAARPPGAHSWSCTRARAARPPPRACARGPPPPGRGPATRTARCAARRLRRGVRGSGAAPDETLMEVVASCWRAPPAKPHPAPAHTLAHWGPRAHVPTRPA